VTEKITQMSFQIQQKQKNLAETRQRLEAGTALSKNLNAFTREFDQFVGLILDHGKFL
jgi:type II secretory pathway component PulF